MGIQKTQKAKNKPLIFSLVIMLLSTSILFAQKNLRIVYGEQVSIKSKILGEERTILISLPGG